MSNNMVFRDRSSKRYGVAVPGFIRNCGTHFATELSVFEDGVIDCWGGVDLDFLARKFASADARTTLLRRHGHEGHSDSPGALRPNEIEGWSHRLVARGQGEDKLPTIEVPKPRDEGGGDDVGVL